MYLEDAKCSIRLFEKEPQLCVGNRPHLALRNECALTGELSLIVPAKLYMDVPQADEPTARSLRAALRFDQ
jgi:hypothetical protein